MGMFVRFLFVVAVGLGALHLIGVVSYEVPYHRLASEYVCPLLGR